VSYWLFVALLFDHQWKQYLVVLRCHWLFVSPPFEHQRKQYLVRYFWAQESPRFFIQFPIMEHPSPLCLQSNLYSPPGVDNARTYMSLLETHISTRRRNVLPLPPLLPIELDKPCDSAIATRLPMRRGEIHFDNKPQQSPSHAAHPITPPIIISSGSRSILSAPSLPCSLSSEVKSSISLRPRPPSSRGPDVWDWNGLVLREICIHIYFDFSCLTFIGASY